MPLATAFATLPPVTAAPTTLPGETTTAPPGRPTTYVVRNGDYLVGIAKAHGVSADDIVTINGWRSVNHALMPGDEILLPAAATVSTSTDTAAPPNATAPLPSGLVPDTAAPPAGSAATAGSETPASSGDSTAAAPATGAAQSYTVKNGDTVYGIAARFGITAQDLVAANGWSSVSHPLYPGDMITVPAPAG